MKIIMCIFDVKHTINYVKISFYSKSPFNIINLLFYAIWFSCCFVLIYKSLLKNMFHFNKLEGISKTTKQANNWALNIWRDSAAYQNTKPEIPM